MTVNIQPIVATAKQTIVAHIVKLVSLGVAVVLPILAAHGVSTTGWNVPSISLWVVSVLGVIVYYVLHNTSWGAVILSKESSASAWIENNLPGILANVTALEGQVAALQKANASLKPVVLVHEFQSEIPIAKVPPDETVKSVATHL